MDRDILEVLESVIQQRCGIHINLRTIGPQRNTYKFSSVSFGISDKGVQSSLGKTGFSSCTAFIKIILLRKHFMVVAKPTLFPADICGRNAVGIGLTNFAEGGSWHKQPERSAPYHGLLYNDFHQEVRWDW